MDCDEQSSRTPVHQSELLASQSHRRRIDDGHQSGHVLGDEAIEQFLVSVL